MKPWLKFTLWGVFIALFFLLAAHLIFSKFYSQKVKEIVIRELNSRLLVKTEINGSVQIVFWEDFPSLQVAASNLTVWGSPPFQDQLLLQAEKVFFKINLKALLQKRWQFQTTTISNGVLHLKTNLKGQNNFTFTPATSNKKSPEPLLLVEMEKILARNLHLTFDLQQQNIFLTAEMKEIQLSGNFRNDQLELATQGKAKIQQLNIDQQTYLQNINWEWEGTFLAATQNESYQIDFSQFNWGENKLAASGFFDIKKHFLQMNGKGNILSLSSLQTLIPSAFQKQFQAYEWEGNAKINLHLEGFTHLHNGLHLGMDVLLENTSLSLKNTPLNATQVFAEIHFDNGAKNNMQTSILQINNAKGLIHNSPFTTQLQIKNFKDPNVQIVAKGTFEISLLQPFLNKDSTFYPLSGTLKLNAFECNFNPLHLKQLRSTNDLIIQTDFELQNFKALVNNNLLFIEKTKANINYKTITLKEAHIDYLQSQIQLNLHADNWKAYLFALNKNIVLPVNQLQINATLNADTLNWNIWQNELQSKSDIPSESNLLHQQIANIGGNAQLNVHYFRYDKYTAQDAESRLQFTPHQIFLHQIKAKTLEGILSGEGYFAFKNKRQEINMHLSLAHIQLPQLFSSFNNFNQTTLIHSHLEGILHANIHFSTLWEEGIFQSDKLYVYADINIENGALKKFKPLTALSHFVKLDELMHIRFAQLKNTIEIKDETLHIPKMLVLSNAFNISLNGSHRFNQEIDYLVMLNLYDVLGKKFGRKKSEFEAEEIEENKFNLFLHISGTTENPIVKYERKGMKQKWQEQKQALKDFKTGKQKPYSPNKENKDWETKSELEEINWE